MLGSVWAMLHSACQAYLAEFGIIWFLVIVVLMHLACRCLKLFEASLQHSFSRFSSFLQFGPADVLLICLTTKADFVVEGHQRKGCSRANANKFASLWREGGIFLATLAQNHHFVPSKMSLECTEWMAWHSLCLCYSPSEESGQLYGKHIESFKPDQAGQMQLCRMWWLQLLWESRLALPRFPDPIAPTKL